MSAARSHHFSRIAANGMRAPVARALPEEAPIAIECNGIGDAVLMASPSDMIDLACGFAAA
jgi:FdhD protein